MVAILDAILDFSTRHHLFKYLLMAHKSHTPAEHFDI